jgi:hypothetical protein
MESVRSVNIYKVNITFTAPLTFAGSVIRPSINPPT